MKSCTLLLFVCIAVLTALLLLVLVNWATVTCSSACSGPRARELITSSSADALSSFHRVDRVQYATATTSTVTEVTAEAEPFYKSWNTSMVTLLEPDIQRNCSALFAGDESEMARVKEANRNWASVEYDRKFNKLYIESEGCEEIVSEFQANFYTSEEELAFPLAFSMNVHNNAQQIVRLLKSIYRPQNAYCIHYDSKSDNSFKKVFDNLARCLPNVIVPKDIVNVVYECYPILEAQLSCMTDLLAMRDRYPWKYTTTLCGKEVPLRTNREIVRLLKEMKGLPALYSHEFNYDELTRKLRQMVIKNNICVHTKVPIKDPVPYGMQLIKSMAYFSLTPEFTDFVLNSPQAKALYTFLKPTKGPEEAYFGTLLHQWLNGTGKGVKFPSVAGTTWIARNDKNPLEHCKGSIVRRVCIVVSGDLHRIQYDAKPDHLRYPFFYNKYNMQEDHSIMDCLEEELVQRNRLEYFSDRQERTERERTKSTL